jgi:8-oxo-dGTP pyrophosphatase MutT (NUDIX family)
MKHLKLFQSFERLLKESDEEHRKNLSNTGFWGKQGAGCIILCRSTKRFLLPLRSLYVLEPNTWGVWGGAIDTDEEPQIAVKRELTEEAGYSGMVEMVPLSIFQKDSFRYYNFLAIVDEEFEPRLNWETEDFTWTELDNLPQPLHFGLKWLLSQDYDKLSDIISSI